MKHLTRRDGMAFTVSILALPTWNDFRSMVEEAVGLSNATDLYVVIDVRGRCRVVVDRSANPDDVTTKWWNGPQGGQGNHIEISYTAAYEANAIVRERRLREAPKMTFVNNDRKGWANLKETNSLFKSTVNLAEGWARLMQLRMSGEQLTHQIAHMALYEADTYGRVQEYRTSGGVNNTVLRLLQHHWPHGEALSKVF